MYSNSHPNQPVIIAEMQCKIGHPSDNRDMNNDDYIARITNDRLASGILGDTEDVKYELPAVHEITSKITSIMIHKSQISAIERLVKPLPLDQYQFKIIDKEPYIIIDIICDPTLKELIKVAFGIELEYKTKQFERLTKEKNKEIAHLQAKLKNSEKEAKNNKILALSNQSTAVDLQNRIDKHNSLPILRRIWCAIFHGV